jgi:hypothetical protein
MEAEARSNAVACQTPAPHVKDRLAHGRVATAASGAETRAGEL